MNGTTQTDEYNGDGLRAYQNSSNGPHWYLYDGDQPIIELASDSGAALVNTFGVAGTVSTHDVSPTKYFTWDPQGNAATQAAGTTISTTNMFDGFGLRDPSTPWPGQFSYGGQWGDFTDTVTGLILMGHRYYDPGTGRFLTRDPIGYAGGINLYAYTGNNPVNELDPSGLDPLNPLQKIEVQHAIAMINKSNMSDSRQTAKKLTDLLNSGRLYAEPRPDDTDAGQTPIWPWTTQSNVQIGIYPETFDSRYPCDGRFKLNQFTDDVLLASVLYHESRHAFHQGFFWSKLHPNMREDYAYAAQLKFLQSLRNQYTSPGQETAINIVIGKFFGN